MDTAIRHNEEAQTTGLCSPVFSPAISNFMEKERHDINSIETQPYNKLDFIWLEITQKCNMSCLHCYSNSDPQKPLYEEMQTQDWNQILEEASALGCRKVQFIGGEPTMHPDLGSLIEYSRMLDFYVIEVFTNGVLQDDNLKEVFIHNKVNLAFSVYGPLAEVHDDITQHKGSFKKTIDSIKWALGSNLSVRVSITVMDTNAEYVMQTREMLKQIGVQSTCIDHVRRIGGGLNFENSQPPLQEACSQCYKNKLCISSTGHVYTCVFDRLRHIGNAQSGLANIFRRDFLS